MDELRSSQVWGDDLQRIKPRPCGPVSLEAQSFAVWGFGLRLPSWLPDGKTWDWRIRGFRHAESDAAPASNLVFQ